MSTNLKTQKECRKVYATCFLHLLHIAAFTFNSVGDPNNKDKDEELDLPLFDFPVIANATNHFSEKSKLGEGGFGSVYKVITITMMFPYPNPPQCVNNITIGNF